MNFKTFSALSTKNEASPSLTLLPPLVLQIFCMAPSTERRPATPHKLMLVKHIFPTKTEYGKIHKEKCVHTKNIENLNASHFHIISAYTEIFFVCFFVGDVNIEGT